MPDCHPLSTVYLIIRMPRIKTLWIKDEYLQHILSGRKTVEVRVARCFCQTKRVPLDDRKGDHFGHPICTLTIEKGTG